MTFAAGVRLGWVFGIIKDKDITRRSFRGNDTGVLWHVSGTVNFSFMVYFDFDLNFSTNRTETTKFLNRRKFIHY